MNDQLFLDGRITFHAPTGTLSITFPQGGSTPGPWTPVRNATATAHYRLGDTSHRLALTGPNVSFGVGENLVTFSHRDHHLRLDWHWTTIGDALEGWLEVANLSGAPIAFDRLDVLRVAGTPGLDLLGAVADWRVYQNGWQSWSPAGVRRVGNGPFPGPTNDEYRLKHLPHGNGLRSEWVTVITAIAGQVEAQPAVPLRNASIPGRTCSRS